MAFGLWTCAQVVKEGTRLKPAHKGDRISREKYRDIWLREQINTGDIKQSEKVMNSTLVVNLMTERAGRQTHLQPRGQINSTCTSHIFRWPLRKEKSNTCTY